MDVIKILPAVILICCSCGSRSAAGNEAATAQSAPAPAEQTAAEASAFDADSAMAFLRAQVDAGPRVPGSEAHAATARYLASTLRSLGADTVIEQRVEATAWNGDRLPLVNILARFAPESTAQRLLLVAHWDSRPWADAETDPALARKPIDGANDGASGVAVLLEIARLLGSKPAECPVDILLTDGEDYGAPEGESADENSWCLGTQAWVKAMPYDFSTLPRYAVLLDMVGGRGARFHREVVSDYLAPDIVDALWSRAARLGLADRFVNERGGTVVDDHLYLNRAGIPAVDIIENRHPETLSFNPTWHTHDDTADNIDPSTLKAVGTLIESIVYHRDN